MTYGQWSCLEAVAFPEPAAAYCQLASGPAEVREPDNETSQQLHGMEVLELAGLDVTTQSSGRRRVRRPCGLPRWLAQLQEAVLQQAVVA